MVEDLEANDSRNYPPAGGSWLTYHGGEDRENHHKSLFRMPGIEYCVTLGDLIAVHTKV